MRIGCGVAEIVVDIRKACVCGILMAEYLYNLETFDVFFDISVDIAYAFLLKSEILCALLTQSFNNKK